MNIPESIKIGGRTFLIVGDPDLAREGLLGDIDHNRQIIRLHVDPEMPEESVHIVLLHECIHGVFTTMGQTDHDEKTVIALAELLYPVLEELYATGCSEDICDSCAADEGE